MTGYISTGVDNIVSIIQIRRFPNQKPWMNSQVRKMLCVRSLAFRSGNTEEYIAAKYKLRETIMKAKRQYREKIESFYSTADARWMWQGLQHITDYKSTSDVSSSTVTLPEQLNQFYAHFKTSSSYTHSHSQIAQPPFNCLTSWSTQRITPCKAAGPDNTPGQALRGCASELADVLTSTSICHSHRPRFLPVLKLPPLSQFPKWEQWPVWMTTDQLQS